MDAIVGVSAAVALGPQLAHCHSGTDTRPRAVGTWTFHPDVCRGDTRPPDPLFSAQSTEPQAEAGRCDRLLGRGRNLHSGGGLAAALSETGDGKVLIVDMNIGRPEVHPFFRGAPACSLTEALVGAPAPAGENLYLAVAASPDAPDAQIIPKKFYDLVPHLKASDFDYIIFDMPPLSQTSITLSIAGFMDKVVLVVRGREEQPGCRQTCLCGACLCQGQRLSRAQQDPNLLPQVAGSRGLTDGSQTSEISPVSRVVAERDSPRRRAAAHSEVRARSKPE